MSFQGFFVISLFSWYPQTHYQPTEQQTDNDNYIELPDPVLQNELLDNDNNADDDEFFGNIGSGVTTEPTDNEQTTMVITTTTVETTTIPISK